MSRINIKFDEPDFEEYVFRQYKSLISINSIDVNEIVVSNKFLFGKQGFKYFIGYKYFRLVTKKLDLYPYFFQKWVYMKDILKRLNVCILQKKMKNIFLKNIFSKI